MSGLRATRRADGRLVVDGIPALLAEVVRELPGHLGPDQPDAVKRRLFPVPTADDPVAAEWRRAQHPELFALLADAKSIVQSDLPSLRRGKLARTWRLEIPDAHLPAWISGRNAARLALGAMFGVVAGDLDPEREPGYDERGLAILRIELYAWLQGTLIDVVSPDGADADPV